jgi:AcrR family transcriptional regulator
LRRTAAALEISHTTLLRHFSTKEELLVEVVHRITTDFSARLRRETGSGYRRSLKEYLVSMWEHLCEPRECRQFLLLFELVTVASREPGEKVALAPSLVDEIIESVQKVLERHRYSKKHARIVATSILAQVREMHLDLAISGALSRVDAAMRDYIEMIVCADLGSAQ